MARFLLRFRETGNVKQSCQASGISREWAYKARRKYVRFREAWDEAQEDAVDDLEQVAWTRAKDGSDYLVWRLLASLRREKYSDHVAVTLNLHQEAAKLAARYGLDEQEIMAEAMAIVSGTPRGH